MMGYELIPAELKQLKQWVCWQAVPDESRPGKNEKNANKRYDRRWSTK